MFSAPLDAICTGYKRDVFLNGAMAGHSNALANSSARPQCTCISHMMPQCILVSAVSTACGAGVSSGCVCLHHEILLVASDPTGHLATSIMECFASK